MLKLADESNLEPQGGPHEVNALPDMEPTGEENAILSQPYAGDASPEPEDLARELGPGTS
eukprot:750480-Hanusia_phi.AAC.6